MTTETNNTKALALSPPDPPEHFNSDAIYAWRQIWPRFDHARFAFDIAQGAMIAYAMAYADWRKALRLLEAFNKEVNGQGRKIADTGELLPSKGGLVVNPYVTMRDGAAERMEKAEAALGLRPDTAKPKLLNWDADIAPLMGEDDPDADVDPDGVPETDAAGNKLGRPKFWTIERVKPALLGARGSITRAAVTLGKEYNKKPPIKTLQRLLRDNPALLEECRCAWMTTLDVLHDAQVDRALGGDDHAREFLLARHHPAYRQKHEVSGPNGKPVQVQAVAPEKRPGDDVFVGLDLARLSDDDKIALSNLAARVDALGSIALLPIADLTRLKEFQAKCTAPLPAPELAA